MPHSTRPTRFHKATPQGLCSQRHARQKKKGEEKRGMPGQPGPLFSVTRGCRPLPAPMLGACLPARPPARPPHLLMSAQR